MIHHKRWQTYNIIRLWNVTCGSWFHQLSRPSLICITVNDNDPVFKMCIFTGLVGSVFQITASSGGCDLTLNCRLIFDGLVAVCRAELFLQNLEIKKSPPKKTPDELQKLTSAYIPNYHVGVHLGLITALTPFIILWRSSPCESGRSSSSVTGDSSALYATLMDLS